MPRVGNHPHIRFRHVKSPTPLYQANDLRHYWSHCWYCGVELVHEPKLRIKSGNSFTRDHIVPAAIGGRKGANCVPACFACNKNKQDMHLEQFRKKINKGALFYGERKEQEIKDEISKRRRSVTLKELLILNYPEAPPPVEFRPKPIRCYVGQELILQTFVTRLLRRLFT